MTDKSWALQRKLLRAKGIGFNSEVYDWFKDVDDNSSQVIGSRKALRDSLLIQAKESRTSATFKIAYFRDFIQRVHNKPTIIGQPKSVFDEGVQYRCQVFLYFRQSLASVAQGKLPLAAEISFRLNETHLTITNAEIKSLATKVKQTLVSGNNGYKFSKGKYLGLYTDKARGYELRIYALNDAEAEQVVKKILSIQDHPFEGDYFRVTEPKRNNLVSPGKMTILGESVDKPSWRRSADVEFSYADLLVYGIDDAINLVDLNNVRSRRKKTYV